MTDLNFDRTEWASLTIETPVDPERRIVDAHHHVWDRGGSRFLVGELLTYTQAGHNVTDTVFVECRTSYRDSGPEALRPIGETEFVAAQARESEGKGARVSAGIVSFADMTLGDAVEEVLSAHEVAGQGRFRGIRHITTWDPDPQVRMGPLDNPGLMNEQGFRRGVAQLGKQGYSFDAWVYHPQLLQLADLARAADETTIVLDHLGGPLGIGPYTDRQETRAQWRTAMRAVAACPNVVVKLGGIGMDFVFGTGWSSRAQPPGSDEVVDWWGDDIRWVIDTFDPSRCMFESNYPVDRQAIGYTVLWNAFQKIAMGYSEDEQIGLFAGNAARVYRI